MQAYVGDLAACWRPAMLSMRYRRLQQRFKWLVEEEEIDRSPWSACIAPSFLSSRCKWCMSSRPATLVASCEGKDFVSRRDLAIIRLFVDTGMRLAEMAGLQVDDLDLELGVALVLGKGRSPSVLPLPARTATALDRYLRVRQRHARATEPALWLGEKSKGALPKAASSR